MAQINKPNTHFNTKLYTGNDGTQSITGVNFQPDFTWIKNRDSAYYHFLFDSVRGTGITKSLYSNSTDDEGEHSANGNLTSFDSDGFSLGTTSGANAINTSAQNLVAWNWLAGGTASSNTDGSITSSVSANTTSGFSIVSYTGTGSVATVGHGLGVAPSVMIFKNRIDVTNWVVYNKSLGATKYLFLQDTTPAGTLNTVFNDTEPTSSVFTVGTSGTTNGSGDGMIAYCFAEKKGFSKVGSYTGNGNADGPFIYTGFKPAFIITRPIGNVSSWNVTDVKRSTYNDGSLERFKVNLSDGESSSPNYDILSNGFKIRTTDNDYNPTGFAVNKVIYMAFAENPLVGTNNIPATAR